MNGTITKYRKKNGRISWGYHYRAEGRRFSKSGFATKFEASKASGVALGRHQDANGVARKGDARTLAEYLDYWLNNRYIEGICSSCHDAGLIRSTEATKEEWYDVVMRMNGKDAACPRETSTF